MENNMFGLKEMYECILKATYDIEIGGKTISAGEPIVIFDSLQIANFRELKDRRDARGGYGNQSWIHWESTEEVNLDFSQGVFSLVHVALLGNSAMDRGITVEVPMTQTAEVDENKEIELKYEPVTVYVWKENGDKLEDFTVDGRNLKFSETPEYTDVKIYYTFTYEDANVINIGRRGIPGFLELTAKTRLKDDVTGKTVTGIIHMPKVKIMSDFYFAKKAPYLEISTGSFSNI